MPIEALWGLVISLAVLAFTVTLRMASLALSLKLQDQEFARLFEKMHALQDEYDKKISGLSQLHSTEIQKLRESHGKAIEHAIDVVIQRTQPKNRLLEILGPQIHQDNALAKHLRENS